jgi:di/tricarboxylate transporter
MAITFIFLALAVVLFVWDKLPISLTSMIICIGLIISGVIDAKTGFAGFVNSHLIVIIDMCIIGGELFETGMATKIGGLVTRFAKTERQQIMGIVAVGGVMSGVLSNTGTTAMLIPVVIGISAKAGFARSRLLMPLAFAASIGANLTMVGASGNLLAQTAIEKIGQRFGFFEIGVIGLPILITTILTSA